MLTTKTYQSNISLMLQDQPDDRIELSRLMAAAVVSSKFCNLLLTDPDLALKTGFQGEDFSFSDGERDLILSIRSNSLPDLANQLARSFNQHLPIRVNPSVCFGY